MALFNLFKRTDTNLNSMTARSTGLLRLRQDVQSWRRAVEEAEMGTYPHRVKMQRLFVDTVLNGHVYACMQKRKDLTLLRDIEVYNADGSENEDLEELFAGEWFSQFLSYALDAIFYGYSLISLGDVIDGKFKNIDVIKRWHISPDRCNVTTYQYMLTGYEFLKPPYDKWHVWATSPSENGQSSVGYGLLYKCAVYEIINRNLLGFNADAAELFGQPIRKGRTNKTEEAERGEFANALANMGSSGWIMLDEYDQVELIENSTGAQGFKIYENLESRNEKKISKLILGHADALDSTPGKLGSDANGASAQALKAIQTADGRFITSIINDQLIPKMRQIGFQLPDGIYFEFSDNEQEQEEEQAELDHQLKIADLANKLRTAGFQVSADWITEETEIPVEPAKLSAPPPPLPQNTLESLRNLYK